MCFLNLFNEFYSRDTSKKVKAVKKACAESGKYMGTHAPYGYQRDPADKHRFIIDEETAPMVRRIFAMRASGMAFRKIAVILNAEGIQPPGERLLVPDMALTAAEYFAVDKGEKVLVLLTDMTLYADALAIVSNRMDQIPSKDSMPGSLYSDLAKIYEKAVQLPNGGSITIIAVTTLSGGDITHAIPDNTGYITEGQLFLRNDSDTGKVIVDPFRSLSRLKQLVIGKKTREDHPQVMNACVRLYADAANAKTKLENGFDLSDYDERTLKFAHDYSEKLLAIDVNIDITAMLDTAWALFAEYFSPEEVAIKEELIKKYWKA